MCLVEVENSPKVSTEGGEHLMCVPYFSGGGGGGMEGTLDVCASLAAGGIVCHASDERDEGQDRLPSHAEGQVSGATHGPDVTSNVV